MSFARALSASAWGARPHNERDLLRDGRRRGVGGLGHDPAPLVILSAPASPALATGLKQRKSTFPVVSVRPAGDATMSGSHLQPLVVEHTPIECTPPSQPEEAEASVLAYATSVARRLMEHIAEHLPPSVNEALTTVIMEKVFAEAAIAAAEGRAFSKTATLLQLLPQLAQIAAQASADTAAALLPSSAGGSSSAGPQGTLWDGPGPAYCQQAQQLYAGSPFVTLQPDSGSGPLPLLHSADVLDPTNLGGCAPPATATLAGFAPPGCFCQPQPQQYCWQQEDQVWQWGGLAMPAVSDCGSTCD